MNKGGEFLAGTFLSWVVLGVLFGVIALPFWGCPHYHVWQQGMSGEAELRKAEQNRKIKILEAEAAKEAAKSLAAAEIERAKGAAEANRIIGEGLKGHEEYLRYLWIDGLKHTNAPTVVYVPTEAGLPVLEAGRLKRTEK